MTDPTVGPYSPHGPASARVAALEIELQTAMALGRAAANALKELSPEASTAFRRQLKRELDRMKLSGGGADVAAVRLKALLND